MAKFEYEILHPKRVNASLLHEEMTNRFAEVFTGIGYNANSLRLRFDRGLTTEEISDTVSIVDSHDADMLSTVEQQTIERELAEDEGRAELMINQIARYSIDTIDNWVDSNVNDLASAKEVLKRMGRAIAALARVVDVH